MGGLLRAIVGIVVVIVLGWVAFAPIETLPGVWIGGTETAAPEDWSIVEGEEKAYIETRNGLPHVVTIWYLGSESGLYVLAIPEASWLARARENPDVRIRIGDSTYSLRVAEYAPDDVPQTALDGYAAKYAAQIEALSSEGTDLDVADFVFMQLLAPGESQTLASAGGDMAGSAASPIDGVRFRQIETNGIQMRIAEAGDSGPLVLLAHGWPESWYSWRHQLTGLAAAGYRVVAPDMRGYGATDAPESVDAYSITELTADMVGVLDALGEETATIVGHDWGSIVAQYSALYYPERFTSLVIMSVPYSGQAESNPLSAMVERTGDNFFYIAYHNEPGGVAEAEYDSNPRGLISRLYLSPDSPREAPEVTDPKRSAGGWIPRLGAPRGLPDWLTQEDLDYIVGQFEEAGFRGGVNYYRNFGRNWEINNSRHDFTMKVPTLFIAGDKDVVIGGATKEGLTAMMSPRVPDLRGVELVPDMGHWIQQEAPEATNAALIEFLKGL